MASMMKVQLIGNVGRDPETRYTQSGTKTVNFSVAVNNRRGEQEETEWFRVTTFGRLAEICEQYVTKGRIVYVDGRLRLDRWTGQDGRARYTLDVTANDVVLMGPRQGEADEQREPQAVGAAAERGEDLENLPF